MNRHQANQAKDDRKMMKLWGRKSWERKPAGEKVTRKEWVLGTDGVELGAKTVELTAIELKKENDELRQAVERTEQALRASQSQVGEQSRRLTDQAARIMELWKARKANGIALNERVAEADKELLPTIDSIEQSMHEAHDALMQMKPRDAARDIEIALALIERFKKDMTVAHGRIKGATTDGNAGGEGEAQAGADRQANEGDRSIFV